MLPDFIRLLLSLFFNIKVPLSGACIAHLGILENSLQAVRDDEDVTSNLFGVAAQATASQHIHTRFSSLIA